MVFSINFPQATEAETKAGSDTEAYLSDLITITPLLFDWTAHFWVEETQEWGFSHRVGGTLDGGLNDADRRRTSRFLAIDHLKIMRNALKGLDEDARQVDLEGGLHGVGYVRDRWNAARLRNGRGDVEVRFAGSGDAAFAENCFEFSTVQRVIYNLLSNACRHTMNQ